MIESFYLLSSFIFFILIFCEQYSLSIWFVYVWRLHSRQVSIGQHWQLFRLKKITFKYICIEVKIYYLQQFALHISSFCLRTWAMLRVSLVSDWVRERAMDLNTYAQTRKLPARGRWLAYTAAGCIWPPRLLDYTGRPPPPPDCTGSVRSAAAWAAAAGRPLFPRNSRGLRNPHPKEDRKI